jgi:N-acetylglutamate synthase-like GNAT family acetyltransferase
MEGIMIVVKTPTTKEDFKAYYALRYRVLSEPWGHPKGTEKDDYEPISEHFMAVDDQTGQVVGCVKLFEKAPGVGNVSHLVVEPERQHKGIGHLLLDQVEKRARERGFKILGSMARVTSTAYFEKWGYHVAEVPAPHLGITHLVWMEKNIAA